LSTFGPNARKGRLVMLLRRFLILLRDKWPKYLSEKKQPHTTRDTLHSRAAPAVIQNPNWRGARCHEGSDEIQSRRHGGELLWTWPHQTKLQPPKLKYETLEISEIFVNLHLAVSCNLLTEQYPQLLPRITSPDHFDTFVSVKRQHSLLEVLIVKLAYMLGCIRPEVRLPPDQRVLYSDCRETMYCGLLRLSSRVLYCIEARYL